MKKVIVLAGTNSSTSINKQLAIYATNFLTNVETEVLDLNNFDVPMFGTDLEKEAGIPSNAKKLSELIENTDGIVLSLAEHNGSYAAVFKNIFDWMSRINSKVWRNKPMLLMATSPGGRGGATVLGTAKTSFPHLGGNIVSDFSLPSFFDNFKDGAIQDLTLETELKKAVDLLDKALV